MGKWSGSEWAATVLDHAILNDEGQDRDANEPSIVAETSEDVEVLVTKLTGVDLVEELHEDESLEHNGVELALLRSRIEEDIQLSGCSGTSSESKLFLLCINVLLVVVEWLILLVDEPEEILSDAEKKDQDDELVESLSEDVSPHDCIDDLGGLACWLAIQEGIIRRLSGKGECSEGVHDQVDPKHLNGSERRIIKDH